MRKSTVSTLALTAPFALVGGASSANEAAWDLLASIEIEEIETATDYEVRKHFPSTIENGIMQFDITGYVVPLTDEDELYDLMLVSDMGFCPFCGSPEHGTSLQVTMSEPLIGYEEGARVTLRGVLEPVTDPYTLQTTVMTGARAL